MAPKRLKTIWEKLDNRLGPLVGTSIWADEWYICCVLDGCRADTFQSVWEGAARSRWSVASTSQTWIERTFKRTDLDDVGYVTGNPFCVDMNSDQFAYFHIEENDCKKLF